MTDATIRGRFTLRAGLKLLAGEGGGVLLQPNPLRLLRLNAAAFTLLQRQQSEYLVKNSDPAEIDYPVGTEATFLDSLWQGGWLAWEPAIDTFAPAVSIVVPVYNRAGEIGDCLEALLAQNYPTYRLEIIIVDDGSTDGTAEVVSRYPVRLIKQPQNRGQSAARNAGVRAAQGEIVAYIDSDCILVEFARKQPRLSLPLFLFFYLAEQAFYQAGVF
jgi:hypothetical protein